MTQNKRDYSTFQPSLQNKITPVTLVAHRQIRRQIIALFWIRVYYQTFKNSLVITSLFSRIVCQLIVYDKSCVLHLCAPEYVESENWPPNSSDLNPVDYSIWGALPTACLSSSSHSRRCAPERSANTYWEQIGQNVIDHAIGKFRKRLSLVVADRWPALWLYFDSKL